MTSSQASHSSSFNGYSHLNVRVLEAHQKGMLLEDERSRCKSLEAELSQAKEIAASTARKLEVLTQEKLHLENVRTEGGCYGNRASNVQM